jgi:hypothetical protein
MKKITITESQFKTLIENVINEEGEKKHSTSDHDVLNDPKVHELLIYVNDIYGDKLDEEYGMSDVSYIDYRDTNPVANLIYVVERYGDYEDEEPDEGGFYQKPHKNDLQFYVFTDSELKIFEDRGKLLYHIIVTKVNKFNILDSKLNRWEIEKITED